MLAVALPLPSAFCSADSRGWPTDPIEWLSSPVDLSFLNAAERPAGKRGFVRASAEGLVFEDGTRARFWGTNLSGPALFRTSPADVRAQARRLSQLGFNLVRLHHHDSAWVVPNVFGERPAGTRALDAAAIERLDWWIRCLKDEGIYVWLDLHVGRRLTRADGVSAFEELGAGKTAGELRGYSFVNPDIREAMQSFNRAYVTHLNPYTGLRYRDDPAIAAMLVTNENDITHHFAARLLPGKGAPRHGRWFMDEALAFAEASGLPRQAAWRSWRPGPAKLFLNDLEYRFHREMVAHLRSLGVRVPIATTNTWGDNPLSSLPALTAGDMIDAHAYGTSGELLRSPLTKPNLIHWLSAAQVAGKPMTVSEWNVEPFPVEDRHASAIYVAANAALQGWSAVLQYAYAQDALDSPAKPSNWHAFNDPALLATLPAAALAYRRGDVKRSGTTYVFAPGKDALFGTRLSPATAVALRTAAERGRLLISLPAAKELSWLAAVEPSANARIISDPQQPLINPGATQSASDSGELRRDWSKGDFVVDTPRTQAAAGRIGGRTIRLSSVEIAVDTPQATVAVQSLDNKPIPESGSILISLGARSLPAPGQALPFRSEPITGSVSIRARKGLHLYRRASDAEEALPSEYDGAHYRIALDRHLGTHWLRLR